MEVRPKKQLHTSAMSIVLVLVGMMFLSLALIGGSYSKALTTRVINIHPGANGLTHIGTEPTTISDDKLGDTAVQAGQNANRSLIFESAANPRH